MGQRDPYAELAEKHGQGNSARFRKILEFMMTPRQADLATRLPKLPEDLAREMGLDLSTVETLLHDMYKKGVVFPVDFQTLEGYRYARNPSQLEASQSLWNIGVYTDSEKRHLWQLWLDWDKNEWQPERMSRISALEASPYRIVPAYKAILDSPEILPCEDVRELVKAARLIAVVSCTCRVRAGATGKPCQRSHDRVCIQFNRSAEYAISRGQGRQLSVDEALALVDEIEDAALLHIWNNNDSMVINTFCNCCTDCCYNFQPLLAEGIPIGKAYAKSRYEARNVEELCDGCQKCVERCSFNAISMQLVAGEKVVKAYVDPELCVGCGVCVLPCDPGSLKMYLVRPREHIPPAPLPPPRRAVR